MPISKEKTTKNNKKDNKLSIKQLDVSVLDTSKVKTSKIKSTKKKYATSKARTTKASTTRKSKTAKATTRKAKAAKTSTTGKSKTAKTSVSKLSKESFVKTKSVASKIVKTPNTTSSIVEYYDLPYRYNQTIVKVLAQNPNTLFVYWDILDKDRQDFENQYGNNFFNITKPVLVVHNLTDNYTFEIDINDFANNWYIHVNDTKCKYVIELGRRPIEKTNNISTDFLNISYSNTMEMPNDHVLFFKKNDKIYFKNIRTNQITQKVFDIKEYGNDVKEIYSNYDLTDNDDDNRFDFKNPSSQNPTSNIM